MGQLCDCESGLKHLGQANCPALFASAYKFVFTDYFKADGTVNELDLSSFACTKAAFEAKVSTATNPWIPSPQVLNYDTERAEAKFESFDNDTVKEYVQDGERTVKGIWAKVPANLANILKGYNCNDVGFYIIDKYGNLIGIETGYQKLAPIRIQKGSFNSIMMPPVGTAIRVQQAMVSFSYDPSECDGKLKMLSSDDIVAGYDLKQLKGNIQVTFKTAGAGSSTTLVVAADTDQGSMKSPIMVTGLVASDFVIKNVTNSNATVSKTVAEVDGVYTFTFTAQTTGDVGKLTCTKAGYNFPTYEFTFQ